MSEPEALVPPPPVVRESLARNIRERRLLRSLLRLSVRVAEECRAGRQNPRQPADGREVGQ